MNRFIIETSARHIHVTSEALKILMGPEAELACRKALSQPGQFLSFTKLDLVGPRKTISGVSILGPCRKINQVEVSKTDARTLGVEAPIRESGDIKGSAPIKIVGPKGELDLKEGLIIAKRHLHMTPKDAERFAVKDGQIVSVRVLTKERRAVLDDVVVRVGTNYSLAFHIDTDEANACNVIGETYGEIVDREPLE